MKGNSIPEAIKGMFSFFTMIPINIEREHMDSMNKKFWLIPIIGAFYGLFAAAVFGLTAEYVSRPVAAAVTIALVAIMNRFLHLDGTIDIGDGLTVAGKHEYHVRALKDTLVGAGGVCTGIIVVLILYGEYTTLSIASFMFIGVGAEVFARLAQITAATFGTAGNGMAGDSVRYTNNASLVKGAILTALIVTGLYFLFYYTLTGVFHYDLYSRYWAALIVGFAVAMVWGFLMSKIANKNFGMVNGDVLGATNETARVVTIFFMILTTVLLEL